MKFDKWEKWNSTMDNKIIIHRKQQDQDRKSVEWNIDALKLSTLLAQVKYILI